MSPSDRPVCSPVRRSLLLAPGQALQTDTGRRVMFPTPKGRLAARLRAIDRFLHAEAVAEARARRDDYMHTLVAAGMDPNHLTRADRDDLNLYLFGHEAGPAAWHLVAR